MSIVSDLVTDRIVFAGLTLFSRHGFNRTSMADIAREAAISRATLYLRFSDKHAVFDALATRLVDEALARAREAACGGGDLATTIEDTILAKELEFFRLINASPHGGELLEVDAALTRRQVDRLDTAYVALLTDLGRDAEGRGAVFQAFDGPEGFARFLATAGAGLKHEVREEPAFRGAVARLARVAAAAARSSTSG